MACMCGVAGATSVRRGLGGVGGLEEDLRREIEEVVVVWRVSMRRFGMDSQ